MRLPSVETAFLLAKTKFKAVTAYFYPLAIHNKICRRTLLNSTAEKLHKDMLRNINLCHIHLHVTTLKQKGLPYTYLNSVQELESG